MKYLLSLLISLFLFGSLLAGIRVDQEVIYKNQPVTITTDDPVDTIRIVYRPNSQVSSSEILTAATPMTSFQWQPAEAGVVAIRAGNDSTNVSVRFQGISWSGIGIMILAGVLLFGGATFAFRLLMYGKPLEKAESELDFEHHPDT